MSNAIDPTLFSAHEQALNHQPCPKCGGALQLRRAKLGPFLGCELYPQCDYIKPLHHNDGHIVKQLGVECPECKHELVLRQGRYGMFIGCSDYPNCHHIESPTATTPSENHTTNLVCPECHQGHLVERQSRFGKAFYACDAFPKCKFAVNQKPLAGQCQACGFPLLVEKKFASGKKLLCANRKCAQVQSAD